MSLCHLISVGYNHLASSSRKSLHDIAAQEAICAEDGHCVASKRGSSTSVFYDRFACAGDGDILDRVAPSLEGGVFGFQRGTSRAQRKGSGLAGLHFRMQHLDRPLSRQMDTVVAILVSGDSVVVCKEAPMQSSSAASTS